MRAFHKSRSPRAEPHSATRSNSCVISTHNRPLGPKHGEEHPPPPNLIQMLRLAKYKSFIWRVQNQINWTVQAKQFVERKRTKFEKKMSELSVHLFSEKIIEIIMWQIFLYVLPGIYTYNSNAVALCVFHSPVLKGKIYYETTEIRPDFLTIFGLYYANSWQIKFSFAIT